MIDIEKIKEYYNNDLILVSEHAEVRIKERKISVNDIVKAILFGEIIE